MDVHVGLWILFGVVVTIALAVDMGLKSHQGAHVVSFREASIWSIFWVTLALAFAGIVHGTLGPERAFEFIAAYLIEKSLSVDNMFVFIMIFKYFSVPDQYQHRVLHWGIIGAIIMRCIIIFAGVALLDKFHWMLYVFGAFLVFTALKMFRDNPEDAHPEKNPVLKLFQRFMPFTTKLDNHHFLTKLDGRQFGTPLLAALLVVEMSDLIFAIDSIPAVLAISKDPFIVFSSNILAILGLRALYFLIHGLIGYFRYLRFGLALVLLFIGAKMLFAHYLKIPIGISLGVVGMVLATSVLLSIVIKDKSMPHPKEPAAGE